MKKSIGIILVALLSGFVSVGLYKSLEKEGAPERENKYVDAVGTDKVPAHYANYISAGAPQSGVDFTGAAELTVHAVVHIRSEMRRKSNVYDYFFDLGDIFDNYDRHSRRSSRPVVGFGSGVIVSEGGYIVTNNHVVQDAEFVEVTLNDKRSFPAKVIGTDPSTDLALLKIEAKGLPYIMYGNSDKVKIGEWVLAVGNPFNLTSTVTAGIVSAKARNINILRNADGSSNGTIESFIQTDAAVNRGNSGGALVNIQGELIGINAAIASGNGYYAGYSFAIPVNIVKKVVDDLIEYGNVQRGYMGVSVRDVNSDLAQEKGIKDLHGVYVAGVTVDGAAEEFGLKQGDVIKSVAGIEVNSTSELLEIIGRYRPGDQVDVLVSRGNKLKAYSVVLKNREGTTRIVKKEERDVLSQLGAVFEPVTGEDKSRLNLEGGVRVKQLKAGKLARAGVREGYIIIKVDGERVATEKELVDLLNGRDGGVLIEGVYPNGMKAYYGFGM